MSQIYFFRHAQASYLSDNYDKLSAHGEKQSAALGQYLVKHNIHLDKIYVGPLVRQRHTQEIVSKAFLDTQNIEHQPILMPEMEEHFGPQALKFMYPKLVEQEPQVQKWYNEIVANEGIHAIKKRNSLMIFEHFIDKWVNGEIPESHDVYESWQLFRQRIKVGLDKILSETGKGETIGVFTSGGVVSAVVAEALAITDEVKVARLNYAVKNTAFTQFAYSRNQFNLIAFNEVPHLTHDMVTFI